MRQFGADVEDRQPEHEAEDSVLRWRRRAWWGYPALKQAPPVDNELPARSFATLGRLLIVAGSGAASPPGTGDAFSTAYFVLLLAMLIAGVSLSSHPAATTQKTPIAADQS